jgi:two-component system, NtrC family, sensor kinase
MINRLDHERHSVLVVDDDPEVLRTMNSILQKDNYDVMTAASGNEALKIMAVAAPCIILTDVMMPEMDGFALCRRLKQDVRTERVPVVLVTAMVDSGDITAGVDAGAVDYIRKPFDTVEILMRVRSQINLHETILQKDLVEKELGIISLAARDGIVTMNNATEIIHWNRAAQAMFGYAASAAIGQPFFDLVAPTRWRTEQLEIFNALRDNRDEAARPMEFTMKTADGAEFPVELTMSSATIDGNWNAVVVIRDISERKLIHDQLSQAQKLESIGQLAAGIAHEINTPAQYVGDNTQFIKDSLGDLFGAFTKYHQLVAAAKEGPLSSGLIAEVEAAAEEADTDYLISEIPPAIENALEGIERISSIVQALKEFAHPGVKEKTHANINHCLETTIIVARNEYKYVADLHTDLMPHLPEVWCRPNELNQVFLNLIVNAAHAIADFRPDDNAPKGRITVRTRMDGDNAVVVEIEDTGAGIPDVIRDRVFDPFFTTKVVGKGTGQGLAIARSIVVDKHGGTLRFESEVGVGTTFFIQLPIDNRMSKGRAIA